MCKQRHTVGGTGCFQCDYYWYITNLNISFSTDPAHQNLYMQTSPLQTCIKLPRCERCIEFSFRRRIDKAIFLSCSVKVVSAGPICNTTALGQWSSHFSDHQHSSIDLSKQHGSRFIISNTFCHLTLPFRWAWDFPLQNHACYSHV